jgi:hypothetical protein
MQGTIDVSSKKNPDQKKPAPRIARKPLDHMLAEEKEIYRISRVFPLTLFPDTVQITTAKVNLIYKEFFYTHNYFTMLLQDIKLSTVSSSLFFASLSFEYSGFHDDPPHIDKLWKEEAITAKDIVTGLIAAQREKIDWSPYSSQEIRDKARELGRGQP